MLHGRSGAAKSEPILVVEDDAVLRDLFSMVLERSG